MITTAQPRRGPGYWLGVADTDYHRGVELTRQRRFAEAEQALGLAVATLEMLAGDDPDATPGTNPEADTDPEADSAGATAWRQEVWRRLALAHWRGALALHLDGRPAEAWMKANRAMEVGVAQLEQLRPGTGEHSEATAQLVTTIIDAAAAAADAGMTDVPLGLYDEAIERCGDDPHPCVRSVLSTALHNAANAKLLHLTSLTGNDDRPRGDELRAILEDIAHLAGKSLAIRMEVVDETDVVSCWELASSELMGAQVLVYCGERATAVELLALGLQRVQSLGPDGRDLGAKAHQLVEAMDRLAPEEMNVAREVGLLR